MNKQECLEGKRFGKLLVLKSAENIGKNTAWLCRCDCGIQRAILTYNLLSGKSRSCGCVRGKKLGDSQRTHGDSKTRLYAIYKSMKQRCYNRNTPAYRYYGGNGIKICDPWLNDFANFKKWSLSNGYNDSLSIDRIDPSAGYGPENCRWATTKQQQNNKLNSMFVVVGDEKHTIAEWAELTGTNKQTLYDKFYRLMEQLGVENKDAVSFEIKLRG